MSLSIHFKDTVLEFVGPLDEQALHGLPDSVVGSCRTFDLAKVSRVNSAGAALWIRWWRKLQLDSTKFTVKRLHSSFIRTLNSVDEMLPASWEIDSFFVPYIGKSDGVPEDVLFVRDTHFNKKEVVLPPLMSSPLDGRRLELDVDPERYFRFLMARFPGLSIKSPL